MCLFGKLPDGTICHGEQSPQPRRVQLRREHRRRANEADKLAEPSVLDQGLKNVVPLRRSEHIGEDVEEAVGGAQVAAEDPALVVDEETVDPTVEVEWGAREGGHSEFHVDEIGGRQTAWKASHLHGSEKMNDRLRRGTMWSFSRACRRSRFACLRKLCSEP